MSEEIALASRQRETWIGHTTQKGQKSIDLVHVSTSNQSYKLDKQEAKRQRKINEDHVPSSITPFLILVEVVVVILLKG